MPDQFVSRLDSEVALNHEARKEVFRKVAGTAIENSHAALKQTWVAIFAGGTYQLIRSFDNFISCTRVTPSDIAQAKNIKEVCEISYLHQYMTKTPAVPWSEIGLLLAFYLIYVLTFYRFYVGNIRVFDMRYIEIGRFVALLSEKLEAAAKKSAETPTCSEKRAGKTTESKAAELMKTANAQRDQLYRDFFDYNNKQKRIVDSLLLMIKTLTIVGLTLEINNPPVFITIYALVLLFDLGWMQVSNLIDSLRKRFYASQTSEGDEKFPEADLKTPLSGNPFFVYNYFYWLGLTRAVQNPEPVGKEREPRAPQKRERELITIFPSRAIKWWTRINAICFGLLAILGVPFYFPSVSTNLLWFVPSQYVLFAMAGAVMLANCVADLYATWGFYNPLFETAHDFIIADTD
ncbi:hypothetical protein [Bradyrhizobium commune]|uniref:Uncharacterized protein n=1 Tax=Bradyrhizobium commune TaxID=83627 RepID=A0A7S9CZP7_9BRAD|nr:hypothetical protein [Bradyrhizobium commune]QPF88511.1 hypothetical protein IC761_18350 [Bradyrhizobium commune]